MKVFIKLDDEDNIININSEIFIEDTSDWIEIDDGEGDKYAHAQGNYLPKPLINDIGYYNYKYKDNKIVECANEDIAPYVIARKKSEISADCKSHIVAGITIGEDHYSLTLEDEINIASMRERAKQGQSVQYHADGKPCRIYTADEFIQIANTAEAHITHHTTYCNLLMCQVESMTNADEIKAVKYGVTELTGELAKQYETIMTTLANNLVINTSETTE